MCWHDKILLTTPLYLEFDIMLDKINIYLY